MNKEYLLNLVSGVENNADINELILGQDEFKDLAKFDTTKLTLDDYKNLLNTNEIVKAYQTSLLDSAVSKGVESFKEKSMQKYIDEALKNAKNEKKTPEQIALDELRNELKEMRIEKSLSERKAKFTNTLANKKIPIEALGLVIGESDEETEQKINLLEEIITPFVDLKVNEKLGQSSYTPPNGNSSVGVQNPWSKDYFNLTKQGEILRKDPGLAKQLMQIANNK